MPPFDTHIIHKPIVVSCIHTYTEYPQERKDSIFTGLVPGTILRDQVQKQKIHFIVIQLLLKQRLFVPALLLVLYSSCLDGNASTKTKSRE